MAPTPAPTTDSDLRVFCDPASVAVVGSTADPAKWGYWLAKGALSGRHRRQVYLVNRSRAEILGEASHADLGELPTVPELVALCVPGPHVSTVVDQALALGVRGFLGITSGVPDEPGIAKRIRAAGARLVGMNSLGLYDAAHELCLAWGQFTAGPIAVVSQSGQVGSEIALLAARSGLGVSRFVSIGNQTDVRAAELLGELAADEATRVVALYLESFAGGAEIVEALTLLRRAGKHTIVLTVGGSEASTRLARSHTGSLTSSTDVVDAALRVAGAVRVGTPAELVDLARLLLASPLPGGRRVAIVGDSGGQTGIAADVTSAAGLRVPEFSTGLESALAGQLPTGAACSNPVDLAGAGEQDLASYSDIVARLLNSDEVDAVVLTGYFGTYGADTPSLAERELEILRRMGAASAAAGKPLLVHAMVEGNAALDELRAKSIPAYPAIDTAVRALANAARLAASGREQRRPARRTDPIEVGYLGAQKLLRDTGIRFPSCVSVRGREDLGVVAERLAAPYVLKAAWLEHKSEIGGVMVGIADTEALAAAFDIMHAALGDGDYVVEELDTRPNTVEILLGARRDPDLGAVIVVGAGGTEAEVYRDVAVEAAPVDPDTARTMLERLTCFPLLRGWRGKPAVDIDALAAAVAAVSELAAAHPDIAEIEINPLRVSPDGVLAVDALVIEQHP
ncbi:acetate--CoA ligase family protein [Nocardia sp. NEAU-G5]|uniref:Acetate--CoA ligase family protein n=1 Tax=Nocardia albiluteola TaxID=2842303 RepID=A0ABS6BA76_9NOCA|nr:acetate--CoA ligase family protein [Nocardia albiluteola]MBU3066675.1 acetate--CoA ligase family protein [Nocardia albiluteola]